MLRGRNRIQNKLAPEHTVWKGRTTFSKGISKVLHLINSNLMNKFRLENNGLGIWQN